MNTYLNTRVSLFATQLWRSEQFDALIAAADAGRRDLLERQGLAELAPPGQAGASLEQRIVARVLHEAHILVRPLEGAARRFLTYWTGRFEMSNVKTLIRGKLNGERPAVIAARLADMGTFARLDMKELLHVEDVAELLSLLQRGPYADLVRHAHQSVEAAQDPFLLEAALDRSYYDGLVERARPLETEIGQPMREQMAGLMDRINLVWLLRYRFSYNLSPAQVYYLLPAARYRLSPETLRMLVKQPDLPGVLNALPPGLRGLLANTQDILEIFTRLEKDALQVSRRVLKHTAPAVARAFAYLTLREHDLRAVRAVLRGGQLGLSQQSVREAVAGMVP